MENGEGWIRTNVELKANDLFVYDEEELFELVSEKVFGNFSGSICNVLVEMNRLVGCDITKQTVTLNVAIEFDIWE